MVKAALITGGAKRIGKSIALSLAEKGYDIALHYRSSKESAEKTRNEIKNKDVTCTLFEANLSCLDETQRLIPDVVKTFPNLSLLINNASIFERISFLDTTPETFDRHFTTNFKSPFFLTQDFARICKNGQIINILDTKIFGTQINYFTYTLTKKILADFTQMAAKALGPDIRVNGISPGLILPSSKMSQSEFDRMGGKIPLQTTGNPDRIVQTVDFLLENSFVTGEIITIDGGEHLK